MSTTLTITQRRDHTASTTLRIQPTASALLRAVTATAVPSPVAEDFPTLDVDTVVPIQSAIISRTATSAASPVETCSTDSDCASTEACKNQICIRINEAAPLGAPSSEPTSHLSTASAVGVSVGVI